jgi:hypothetical protein
VFSWLTQFLTGGFPARCLEKKPMITKTLEIHVARTSRTSLCQRGPKPGNLGRWVERVEVRVGPGASIEYRAGEAVYDVCNARAVHSDDIEKVVCDGREVSWEFPNITPYPY